jgi:hypothetical protein
MISLASACTGDRIYMIGGFDGSATLRSVEFLNTANATSWAAAPSMDTARYVHAAVITTGECCSCMAPRALLQCR